MNLPRKRTLLGWHRWMGLLSALFLLVLSLTGLALNHTELLKLDSIQVRYGFILNRYNMESGKDIKSYRIHESDTLSYLAGNLFYNETQLFSAGAPVGFIEGQQITAIATEKALIYISPTGELIETIRLDTLPFEAITTLGQSPSGLPVLATNSGNFVSDLSWIEFEPYEGDYTVNTMNSVTLDPQTQEALLEAFQGSGVSLYRVILDLHSGRLFGWGGRTAMDLTAVAILLLIASGISGWLRKSRRLQTN